MTDAELMDMLGLDDTPAPVAVVPPADAAPTTPPSPTALDLDKWSLRRGQDLTTDVPELANLDLADTQEAKPQAVADLHGAAHEPAPRLVECCTDRLRHRFLTDLMGTEEYSALHVLTAGKRLAAEMATVEFATRLDELRRRERTEPTTDPTESDMRCLGLAADAVAAAGQRVRAMQATARAFGIEPSTQQSAADCRRIGNLFRRVRNHPLVRRTVEYAGRYLRLAQSRQRIKTLHGYDDMVGVTLGDDLQRLTSGELALLGCPATAPDVLRRLVDRQAVCRDYRGVEPTGRGPILLALDESGSMKTGDRIHMGKAIALSMVWIASHQKRWCGLLGWSGKGQRRLLALPPGKSNPDGLVQWLEGFFQGGTYPPLTEMDELWRQCGAPVGRTDVILITDDICQTSAADATAFRAWKTRAQARLITLVLGAGGGALAALSDELHLVGDLEVTQDAVGRAVSI